MMNIPGVTFYLVGGSVRDALLGKTVKDKDYVVVTDMGFDELAAALEKAGYLIYVRKPEFLTLRVRTGTETVDIAFPRVDGPYKDGRRPEGVTPAQSLKEDASRRDFTINSLYMAADGEIGDFFGGERDLAAGVIRTVGDPDERFKEDYLRILRAIRFSATLRFNIDYNTHLAMVRNAHRIALVSADRIREELSKALRANPKRVFQEIDALGLWGILFEKGITFGATQREQ